EQGRHVGRAFMDGTLGSSDTQERGVPRLLRRRTGCKMKQDAELRCRCGDVRGRVTHAAPQTVTAWSAIATTARRSFTAWDAATSSWTCDNSVNLRRTLRWVTGLATRG